MFFPVVCLGHAELDLDDKKIGVQLKHADQRQIPWVAVVGESEAENGTLTLKHLTSGAQDALSPADAAKRIRDAS